MKAEDLEFSPADAIKLFEQASKELQDTRESEKLSSKRLQGESIDSQYEWLRYREDIDKEIRQKEADL